MIEGKSARKEDIMNWISTSKKDEFLKWFLNNHQLKNKEARRLIEYIQKNHHILKNLSFTDYVHSKDRTIVVSSINSDESGFLFYTNGQKTEDVSRELWFTNEQYLLKKFISSSTTLVNILITAIHSLLKHIEFILLNNTNNQKKMQKQQIQLLKLLY